MILMNIFGPIETYFVRLDIYTGVPLTPEATKKMVQITVEVLDILAIVTKEINQSRASESDIRIRFHDVDIVSEKFLKRMIRQTDLEDGMKKLDKLTNEVVAIASAQLLKVTHNIEKDVVSIQNMADRENMKRS